MGTEIASLQDGSWLVKPDTGMWKRGAVAGGDAYVGVDFGTATTVASVIVPSPDGASFAAQPMQLRQPSAHGGSLRSKLVNTVLSWRDGQLLFGADAYELRSRLQEGRNTFSSFKMGLGLDLGPEYPNSVLAAGRVPGVTVERPADAVREFLKLVTRSIAAELAGDNGRRIHYAFTVPAAFQANQRRDLLAAIRDCGVEAEESCLIDEPNAAFLSYVHDAARSGDSKLLDLARNRGVKVLVFDFGAGTCDVSVLEFAITPARVKSRNLAISKFTALGGDDIDRGIVAGYLLDQLRDADGKSVDLTARDIEESVTRRLMPAAERLKISISKKLSDAGVRSLTDAQALDDLVFRTHPVPSFRLRGQVLGIAEPSLSIHQFLDVLSEFCGDYSAYASKFHVAQPIEDVLDKAALAPDDIDAVLFIGGSSSSALIRSAVMDRFPPDVTEIVPHDLRVHVSQGAAIHSLGVHRFGTDLIAPITSEPICVITRGGSLETLIPVASPVPMPKPFELNLEVPDSGQARVDVPVCSGARERLVGIVSIKAEGRGFKRGDPVHVVGRISKEKILEVEVTVAGKAAGVEIMNPLSNGTPSAKEVAMLKEKQRFNQSILQNHGRPTREVVLDYSSAAANAGAYELAADLLVALERIETASNYASSIGVYYNRAGRSAKGGEWHRIAYERRKTALTAYNMYCTSHSRADQERYLREALRHDENYVSAMGALAELVANTSPQEAARLNRRVVQILTPNYRDTDTDIRQLEILHASARAISQEDLAQKVGAEIQRRRHMLDGSTGVYSEQHLATRRGGPRSLMAEK